MPKSRLLRPATRVLLAVAALTGGALAIPTGHGTAMAAITNVAQTTPAAPSVDTAALARQRAAAQQAARVQARRIARERRRERIRERRRQHRLAVIRHRRAVREHQRAVRLHRLRMVNGKALRAFDVASDQKGDPYVWGATGPNAFDCSGLTSYAYHRVGLSLPRTAAAQSGAVRRIPRSQMHRGDLVFFSSGGHVYHVGLWDGRRGGTDYIVHAPHPGASVRTEAIWTSSWFGGTVR
ncbi:C40 family peptidase [Nocardioides sp. CER19]|uniref:C40 family peptidase n=1 Tax=Nocardioides sp. CER19 TaxID=3038538 RepID=UPI0024488851|nr:C40 family peptidase [Nocardioides sp. CER19]MDH2413936.1 C40 family peptidase [Nocardioides sp. CER19]